MRNPPTLLALLAAAALTKGAAAAELGPVSVSGLVGVDTRFFPWEPMLAGQAGNADISFFVNPEFRYRTENGKHQFSFIPFARISSRDSHRTHFDIREAYWLYKSGDWEILTGFNRVFWGVTESNHLVNIINQIDGVEDIDGEDYLGQPMVNLTTYNSWGQVDIFVLPGFRERTFPGPEGRFRTPLPVDTSRPIYTSNLGQKHTDVALRYSNFFGDFDVGVYYFYGTGREPTLVPDGTGDFLLPRYDVIQQGGLDIQYTKDAWLLKFEGIIRQGQGRVFGAFTAGFEYTLYQVFDSAADIGLLVEYLYDGRDMTAPITLFEDDVFFGMRLALNDTQDTTLLVGAIVDPSTSEIFFNIEAERRISNHYTVEIRARFFTGADPGELTFFTSTDDYIQIRLARYF